MRHRFKMVPCTIVLVLGILFMETLSLPLNLEVSIKGAQNRSITSLRWTCMVEGQFCTFHNTLCCKPLQCRAYMHITSLILTCQKKKDGAHLKSIGKNIQFVPCIDWKVNVKRSKLCCDFFRK